MAKKRVLHCLVRVGSGGVEQRRLALAKYLSGDKYDQLIVCTDAFGDLPRFFEDYGVPVKVVGEMKGVFSLPVYLRSLVIALKFRPSIIHGAVFEGVLISTFISLFLFWVPLVIEETSFPCLRSRKANLLFRLCSFRASKVIAVSRAVSNYLKFIKVNEGKIELLVNGVDEESVKRDGLNRDSFRAEMGVDSDEFLVGAVGRVEDKVKKFSDILIAVKTLRNTGCNVRLVVVGDGEDLDFLRNKAISLSVDDYVIWAGYQSDLAPYYDAMDLLCVASVSESFGLVIVEAMFHSLPVVATSVGGVPDVVLDGVTGSLVPPGKPEEIARSILPFLNDKKLCNAFGLNGRKRAVTYFSSKRYVSDVDELYSSQ